MVVLQAVEVDFLQAADHALHQQGGGLALGAAGAQQVPVATEQPAVEGDDEFFRLVGPGLFERAGVLAEKVGEVAADVEDFRAQAFELAQQLDAGQACVILFDGLAIELPRSLGQIFEGGFHVSRGSEECWRTLRRLRDSARFAIQTNLNDGA